MYPCGEQELLDGEVLYCIFDWGHFAPHQFERPDA